MFEPQPIDAAVHVRFRQAFGDPTRSLGGGEQWTLEPFSNGPPIHVLLNGSRNGPTVWVFDPSTATSEKGSAHTIIADEAEVEGIIRHIRTRLEMASERNDVKSSPNSSE